MNVATKNVIQESIIEYREASDDERKEMISKLKSNLESRQEFNYEVMYFEPDIRKAANIFLRISTE